MNTPPLPIRVACWLPLSGVLIAVWLCVLPCLRADETVRQIQEELRRRDLYFGDIDGRTSQQVASALRNYQKRKGFAPTGEPDETTLRSLNLLPPLPLASSDSVPSPTPWPDITVLRSDVARRTRVNVTGDPEATPLSLPTPGPPPAAASRSRPDPDILRAFIRSYLQAGQTNDTEAELAFYADHVDYFDEGNVDRHFIRSDVDRYDHRWPNRHFALLDPLTFSDPPDGSPDKIVVHFRLAFTNKRPHTTVEGKTDNAFTLAQTGPESFRIVGMKEQRVR